MKILSIAMSIAALAAPLLAECAAVATNCARLAELVTGAPGCETEFAVTGLVESQQIQGISGFYILDSSGAVACADKRGDGARTLIPGDFGTFRGGILHAKDETYIVCREFIFKEHRQEPEAADTTVAQFLSGEYDYRKVRIRGIVRNVFRDENDPKFAFMPILCDQCIIYAAMMSPPDEKLPDLTGAEVVATGFCAPLIHGSRQQIGRSLQIGTMKNITILKTAIDDPFSSPEIGNLRTEHPSQIPLLGRRRAVGRVLATWDGNKIILAMTRGRITNVTLDEQPTPRCGEVVEVAGFPETDLYRINLVHAVWRPLLNANVFIPPAEGTPHEVSPNRILTDSEGRQMIDATFHGRTIRIKGIVATLPNGESHRLNLKCGNSIVPVEVSSADELHLEQDCIVEATGVCVMETERNWSPNSVFPRMKGFFLVLRAPEDIRIVSHPPWWTPQKMMVVVLVLALIVVIVLVWNRSLRRLAERRGRELAAGDIARAEADIRTLERTRLAVELHDSVAQTMNGAVMELKAAERCVTNSPQEMTRHLGIVERTLKSTIGELRNCLWDLRSQSLDEKDFAEAIRRTLLPHTKGVALAVRFSVPREIVTDNTAHTILRVTRELAINAIKHGHAKSIKVAGAVKDKTMMISVTDDGCGFDPENRPGVAEGHFGIQGIRERLRLLAGEISYDAEPGRGTKATVTINLPGEDS